MPRYRVPVEVYLYGDVLVSAGTLTEAIRIANERLDGNIQFDDLESEIRHLKVDGVLALTPEVKESSVQKTKFKKATKVQVRKGSSKPKELVGATSTPVRKGRLRG